MADFNIYEMRLKQVIDTIADAQEIDPVAKNYALSALSTTLSLQQRAPALLHENPDDLGFWNRTDETLSRVHEALSSGSPGILDWTAAILKALVESLMSQASRPEVDSTLRERALEEALSADELIDRVRRASTRARYDESSRVLDEIEDVAGLARTAAGTIGGDNLAQYFGEYAAAEKLTAEVFRWSTIGLIAAGATLSLVLPHSEAGDWVGLAYRLVFVAAVAGLAAYFGRQSSQHRRIANWAKALHVQLLAFPAFVSPIEHEESRNAIYSAFAARVLGAPPERSSSKSEPELDAAQIVELVTALIKKS